MGVGIKACSPHGWSHERVNGIYRGRTEERANRVGTAPKLAAPDRIAGGGVRDLGWGVVRFWVVVSLRAEAGELHSGEPYTGGSTIAY